MRIGNVEIKNNIALAPMAGVTDLPFDFYARSRAVGLCVQRWSSAKAVLYNNRYRRPDEDSARGEAACIAAFWFRPGYHG